MNLVEVVQEMSGETCLGLKVLDHGAIFKQTLDYGSHSPIILVGRLSLMITHVEILFTAH